MRGLEASSLNVFNHLRAPGFQMLEPLTSFLTVLALTPLLMRLGLKTGLTGVDIHKPEKPVVPKTGGVALIAGCGAGLILYMALGGETLQALSILLPMLIAGSIGFAEDLRGELNPKLKPLLLIPASAPILLMETYLPRPVLPFIGGTRLYRVYPVLIAASYPIVCNAVNSLDVLNGSMAYTSLPFFAAMALIAFLRGDGFTATASLTLLAALAAFLIYNSYPSRVFAGNSGSLGIGAAMASIAILGRAEVAAIIALLPHIMNEMHVIFSMGGLRSAKQLPDRPVKVEAGMLTASPSRGAPITLVRMLAARAKVREREMVRALAAVSAFAAALALLTDILFVEV